MSFSAFPARPVALAGLLILLLAAVALSLFIGAKTLPAAVVMDALTGVCQSADCIIIKDARLPRTLAGLLAGGALGLAGALMQTLTRNPLADPGLLGVNAGASFAIVLGAALIGITSPRNNCCWRFAARWQHRCWWRLPGGGSLARCASRWRALRWPPCWKDCPAASRC